MAFGTKPGWLLGRAEAERLVQKKKPPVVRGLFSFDRQAHPFPFSPVRRRELIRRRAGPFIAAASASARAPPRGGSRGRAAITFPSSGSLMLPLMRWVRRESQCAVLQPRSPVLCRPLLMALRPGAKRHNALCHAAYCLGRVIHAELLVYAQPCPDPCLRDRPDQQGPAITLRAAVCNQASDATLTRPIALGAAGSNINSETVSNGTVTGCCYGYARRLGKGAGGPIYSQQQPCSGAREPRSSGRRNHSTWTDPGCLPCVTAD